jgi:hypothetical protein
MDNLIHECPWDGDITNDCADCIYAGDFRYDPDTEDCVRRDNDQIRRTGTETKSMNELKKMIEDALSYASDPSAMYAENRLFEALKEALKYLNEKILTDEE